jgi:perosamine synthetase
MDDIVKVCCPTVSEETLKDVCNTMRSGWFGNGPKTREFEEAFAKYTGFKYAVADVSGTEALRLIFKMIDRKSSLKGAELITTPLTFVSDAILADWFDMDLTFADIDEDTLCMDPNSLVVTDETKVILPVDSHGRLADIKAIREKATFYYDAFSTCPFIVEDAAHAMWVDGVGKYADFTMFSFQAVKTLPIGDGGMIVTNDEEDYKEMSKLRWLNIEKSTWERQKGNKYTWNYDITRADGIKAYMNDIFATIGLGQLKDLNKYLAHRRQIQATYNEAFRDIPQIKIPAHSHTVQYYTMQCDNRDKLAEHLAEEGISTSVHFKPLYEMTYYKKGLKRELPICDRVWKRLLSLPCHDDLTPLQQERVIHKVLEFYGH